MKILLQHGLNPGPLSSGSLAASVYLFNKTSFCFVTFVTKQAVAEIYFCFSKKIK